MTIYIKSEHIIEHLFKISRILLEGAVPVPYLIQSWPLAAQFVEKEQSPLRQQRPQQ